MLSQRLVGLNLKMFKVFLLCMCSDVAAVERQERTHSDTSEALPATSAAVAAAAGQAQGDWASLVPVQVRFPSPNSAGVSMLLCAVAAGGATSRPRTLNEGWFKSHVTEADAEVMEHSGKMVLLFQILKMAEELGDKVYAALSIWRPAGKERKGWCLFAETLTWSSSPPQARLQSVFDHAEPHREFPQGLPLGQKPAGQRYSSLRWTKGVDFEGLSFHRCPLSPSQPACGSKTWITTASMALSALSSDRSGQMTLTNMITPGKNKVVLENESI